MTLEELHAALEAAWPGASKLKALSIRQPWAYQILHEGKDVENRSWPTKFRGPVLIHAGKQFDGDLRLARRSDQALPRGGIVGITMIVDCVTEDASEWFFGDYGFLLRCTQPLPFIPCKGALSFFTPKPYEVEP